MGMCLRSRRDSDTHRDDVLPGHPADALPAGSRPLGLSDDDRDYDGLAVPVANDEHEQRSLAALLQESCNLRATGVARALLRRFNGIGGVLSASGEALISTVPGETAAVRQLRLVSDTLAQALRSRLCNRRLLSDEPALLDYLTLTMGHASIERFRVLFLDARNCLLRDEIMATGSVRGLTVHPREVIRRALELGSTALIVVHNHPSGDPNPSQRDIATTRRLIDAAELMGLQLLDHLIIARAGYVSFKRLGFL